MEDLSGYLRMHMIHECGEDTMTYAIYTIAMGADGR